MADKRTKQSGAQTEIPSILSKITLLHGDRVLWVIVATLMTISVLVVYSSVAKMGYAEMAGTTNRILMKHLAMVGASLVAMLIAYRLSCKQYHALAPWVYLLCLLLTLGVYFFGAQTNDAARWYNIFGVSVQPSELLKVATILFLARQLSFKQRIIDTQRLIPSLNPMKWRTKEQRKIWLDGTLPILLPIVLSCIVILPAHTSSAMLVFGISLIMMFIARVRKRELLKIVLLTAAAAALFVAVGGGRSRTANRRISSFVESWTSSPVNSEGKVLRAATDTELAMVAIYDGDITGVGAGQSVMRAKITHPESDYIFAFFVEEYGIIMAILLIVMYVWIFVRAVRIFKRSDWIFGGLLVIGMAMLITVQALLHFMVSINFFPETGQNLPLISHGGTSMICTAVAFGVMLAISRQIEEGTLVPPSRNETLITPTDDEEEEGEEENDEEN